MSGTVAGGVLLAALAALAYESGYALQALGARAVPAAAATPGLLARLVRRRAFLAGAALGVTGFALQVLALHRAPLAVVQPVLALGLVGLLAFATAVLGERPGRREVGGVLAVAAGAALVLAAAPATRHAPGDAAPYVTAALVALAAGPLLARATGGWWLVLSVAAADVLVALAGARLGGDGRVAPGWALLAGGCALAAVTAESAALQRLPAVRVGPVVLAAQAVVPILLGPVVVGDRLPGGGALAAFAAGLAVLAAGVVALASSRRLAAVMAAG